jgi:DNA recombination protein RmuC
MLLNILWIVIFLAVMGNIILLWRILQQGSKPKGGDEIGLKLLLDHMHELNRTVDGKMTDLSRTMDSKITESSKLMNDTVRYQANESSKLIKDITHELTKVQEGQKQATLFADQLKSLQDMLKNPKQRGMFGEYYLETLLKNSFHPNQYEMQYKFSDGTIVDAALFFGDKIIPIDSKFSLENYNRMAEEQDLVEREQLEKAFKQDLKNRIDETAKYIRPQDGTLEFAFMFIPAEGIYYDLLVNKVGALKINTRDLIDYAINQKKVHIVSPTTFYVSLQAIAHGMNAYKIQESTKDILKNIVLLGRHLKAYDEYFRKVGSHLVTTVNAYNGAQKEFVKIDKDVLKLTGESLNIEALTVSKPDIEE